MKRGKFIVFEGGEGTGKSTVIATLRERLQSRGIDVVVSREPGGSYLADQVRRLLVTREREQEAWTPNAEFLLFAASRAQHIDTVIQPALKRGAWVLCDRFMDSSMVYQGMVSKASSTLIQQVHRELGKKLTVDLTLVFDVPVKVALARAFGRGADETHFEHRGEAFHEKVRRAYRRLSTQRDRRRRLIDAAKTPELVAEAAWAQLCQVAPWKT